MYFDEAATSEVKPEVANAIFSSMKYFGNPSAIYSIGREAKAELNKARKTVADFIGAKEKEVIFTSGASESNCTVLKGFVSKIIHDHNSPWIISTKIEHHSTVECLNQMEPYSDVDDLDVDKYGFIDETQLEYYLKNKYDRKGLVSFIAANNEIGTIQRIKEITNLCHKYGFLVHIDATQLLPYIKVDVNEYGIDMMSGSFHKFGAPKGIGLLYIRDGVEIDPLITGSQMEGRRGGTENVPYIIGAAKACEILQESPYYNSTYRTDAMKHLTEELLNRGCRINGALSHDRRLRNNLNVTFDRKITGEALIYMLDTDNIYISAGSACNSVSIEPSHVLTAIGLSPEEIDRTVRITLPDETSIEDVNYFINKLDKALRVLEGSYKDTH